MCGIAGEYNVDGGSVAPGLIGRNALRAAVTKYNWQKQEETLLEVYRAIRPG